MILFVALALAAGVCLALQAPTNAALAARTGLPVAILANAVLGLLLSLGMWLLLRAPVAPEAGRPAPAHWLGGLYGFAIVTLSAIAVARLGATRTLTILVAAQAGTALVLDHVGALGLPRAPVTATRLLGVALVVGGAWLVRR